jgi:hypothetical protein
MNVGNVREVNNTEQLQLMFEGLDRTEATYMNWTDIRNLANYLYG